MDRAPHHLGWSSLISPQPHTPVNPLLCGPMGSGSIPLSRPRQEIRVWGEEDSNVSSLSSVPTINIHKQWSRWLRVQRGVWLQWFAEHVRLDVKRTFELHTKRGWFVHTQFQTRWCCEHQTHRTWRMIRGGPSRVRLATWLFPLDTETGYVAVPLQSHGVLRTRNDSLVVDKWLEAQGGDCQMRDVSGVMYGRSAQNGVSSQKMPHSNSGRMIPQLRCS
ncbi:hypothetical protein PM082_021526 [Marasmius tenuissimus]|nr:hypothetical protein PM082_021526 [Marasmius tenuissimus]